MREKMAESNAQNINGSNIITLEDGWNNQIKAIVLDGLEVYPSYFFPISSSTHLSTMFYVKLLQIIFYSCSIFTFVGNFGFRIPTK